MNEVWRYEIMNSLGAYCRGGLNTVILDQGTVVVLATDYDALAARVQAVEREAVQIHHRGECRIAQDYYEEMNRLQDKLTASEQDAARLREAALWAMKKVKRLSTRAVDYKRADDFIQHEEALKGEGGQGDTPPG